ncbi:MAG: trypsin-like peptidase domain-containing protein [Thermoguttaceae bacterium]|nr:trypsin-like peptidase domain-containing protein [Thermoguttaceae bacterium]
MAMIPKAYMDAVVSIGIRNENNIHWFGTGFFVFRKIDKDTGIVYLVTNRHVFEGKNSVVIRLKKKDTNDLIEIDIALKDNDKPIFFTHQDPQVNIAALVLRGDFLQKNDLTLSSFDIETNAITSTEFCENGGDEGSLIYMLGYPIGLVNEKSNIPICRLGCIARIDKEQVSATNNFLIDIQNFPGNSGSPIISRPELVAIQGSKPLNRSLLLGIIHSYIKYQELLQNTQTGQIVEVRSENSGIANVHPVEYIKELIEKVSQVIGTDQ